MAVLEFDLDGNKKFKNQTVKMSSKELEADITFKNDIDGQVVWASKGNDIIITAYAQNDEGVDFKKVLGTVTLKNAGTKEIVEKGSISLIANGTPESLLNEVYTLGDKDSKKKQTIKGSYLNNDIYGGDGNDALYGVGGYNYIEGGKGSDKLYSGENEDLFIINKGDAIKDDIIYNATSKDDLLFDYSENTSDEVVTKFTKTGNDLVISVGEYDYDTDNVKIDKFFTAEDTINEFQEIFKDDKFDIYTFGSSAIYKNGEDIDAQIIQFGNEKKANTLTGTRYGDLIYGGSKADKITTGAGNDTIVAGKGNDTITIDGYGIKTAVMNAGDGNDTIMYENPKETPKMISTALNVIFATSEDEEITYSYKKSFTDLTITATREDGKSESVTLKGYYDPMHGTPDSEKTPMGYTSVNGELVSDELNIDTTTIGSAKVSDLLKVLKNEYGIELPKGIKVPSALGAINVHLGSAYNDEFTGTTGKDVMVSFGGDNEFTTGAKGQTVIASLGEGHDDYNVKSFTAGTAIIDADGNYDLLVNGVDTNDIHMLAANGILGSHVDINYMTDKTGITNLAGIDYKGIYDKVINAISALDSGDEKKAISAINTAIAAVPGVINKFRGVAVASAAGSVYVDDEPLIKDIKPLEIPKFEDINITDKKGNKQVIAGEDIALLSQVTNHAIGEYLDYINMKYSEIVGEEFENITDVAGYLLNPKDGEKLSKAEQKAYNDIKSGLFNTFKNIYIGTTGDESYTIKKAEGLTAIVSGTGSDSFTFSGDIGTNYSVGLKSIAPNSNYEIYSRLGENDKDTITFKNYSMGDSMYFWSSTFKDSGTAYMNGINFDLYNYKKKTSANVNYGVANESGNEIDLSEKKFELTLKDSKRTYEVTAEYDNEAVAYDWSKTKENHIATIYADDVNVKTGKGYNQIIKTNAEGVDAKLNYTYGGGEDTIISEDNSNDTYNVALTKNTKLSVEDWGMGDTDEIVVTDNKLSNTKFFVNIDNEGWVDSYSCNLLATNSLKKSDFTIEKGSYYSLKSSVSLSNYAYLEKGVMFAYDQDTHSNGIEAVTVGGQEINMNGVVNELQEQVSAWFANYEGKGDYSSVSDVIANGTAKEVNQVLAIYNNIDLSQYIA